ncbi:MAG: hypothetical protein VX424_23640 [Actinomycetota bacterium]|nr:hypothetical protein [Actinomycetota bacterium]
MFAVQQNMFTCLILDNRCNRIALIINNFRKGCLPMAAEHGTRARYNAGCRCGGCVSANSDYHRQRRAGLSQESVPSGTDFCESPGPVELGVQQEIDGPAADARPGLAQVALCLARLMDNPRAVNQQPAAAKALASMLDKLRAVQARSRRGGLSVVREMTRGGA